MRTLKFIIEGQTIKQDPNCDFSGLVPGTSGYLMAEFSFSKEWKGLVKVAGFVSGDKEYEPKILENGKTCIIPAEVLERTIFSIYVIGKKDGLTLTTNKVIVSQK